MVDRAGLEGGAVYALSARLRDAIAGDGERRSPSISARPDAGGARRAASAAARPVALDVPPQGRALPPVAIALMREAGALPEDPEGLAARVKALPLVSSAPRRSTAPSRAPAASPGASSTTRFMLVQLSGRLRRGRDDRLGGADRRLSAAGLASRPAPRPDAARRPGSGDRRGGVLARAVFRSTHRGRHRERSVAIQRSTRLPIALAALATSARALGGQ